MIFEKLFYKKRNIYCSRSYDLDDELKPLDKRFQLYVTTDFNELEPDINQYIVGDTFGLVKKKNVEKRLNNNNFLLFYIKDLKDDKIAASYWAYIPDYNDAWFDSFALKHGEALLCNAYVDERYRRRGLYSYLIQISHYHLHNIRGIERVYTIVEQSNKASDSVNRTFYEKVYSVNSLFKLVSFNIFSVLSNNHQTSVFFVPAGICLYEKT